jgi:hypothetical protein
MMRPLRPLAALVPMRQPPPWVLRVGLQGTPGWCIGALLCQQGTRWAVQLHKARWGWCLPCENIPTWISLCVTTVFSQQGGLSIFKFPKRFSEISWAETSLYSLYWLLWLSLTL